MLLLMHRLGRDYFVWDKAATIEFVRPGKGTVATEFNVDDATVAQITAATAGGDKLLHSFENAVTDAAGQTVAVVRKQVYVRLKPDRRPAQSNAQGDAPAA